MSTGPVGNAEVRARQSSVLETRKTEVGPAEVRSSKMAIDQRCSTQIRPWLIEFYSNTIHRLRDLSSPHGLGYHGYGLLARGWHTVHSSSSIPASSLRDVVEAALDIAVLATPAGRDAVLMLLSHELASAIPRLSTTRMDTMSIVSTCARYPGGLAELAEAIRFYADGAIAMTRLDAAIANHSPARPPRRT
jgi:effector-associated domain 2 (EAD2)-containing protein